nr:Dihydrofolate reductase [uncultured bacterium]
MISLIAAIGRNNELGKGNDLLWRLPSDQKFFRETTKGHTVIMGRKTFESIGRALPGRTSIVITRQPNYRVDGVLTARNLFESLRLCGNADQAFVIGGGEIYSQALPLADRLYLTAVDAEVEGDTYFPPWDEQQWRMVEETTHPCDAKNSFAMRFQIYDRKYPV